MSPATTSFDPTAALRDAAASSQQMARQFCKIGNYAQAVFAYQQALQLKPDPILYTELGTACVALGQFDVGIAAFQKAIQMKADHLDAYYHLGLAYYEMGRDTDALDAFRTTLELHPQDPEIYRTISEAFDSVGRSEEGLAALHTIIKPESTTITGYNFAATVCIKLKMYAEALEAYNQAVRLTPRVDVYGLLGAAYARLGKPQEARNAFEEASKLTSPDVKTPK